MMNGKTAEDYMRLALKEAEKARAIDEVPVGAVIVQDGKVIARAHNLREKNQQASAHAEMLAIQKASRKLNTWCLNDCDLYVTLEPCMMCSGAISLARIRHLYFGTEDPKGGATVSRMELKSIPHIGVYPREVTGGILKEECAFILSDFFRQKRAATKEHPRNRKPVKQETE
ncbi:MAG: nucleoside deaminase [Solobacterium sp.]|nr:nucleoside deaminase [Solobacterium sp.]MBR3347464.1 nucleoside deaminase [Solobacterium sp.]